ncbi:flagellar biosynthetic protein FliO [Clostridium magnum]|uniref:Flagellar protein FliO/FliZ n=1 Tax=Clostridium magnum DSM 2767 TaxID=1121326 RepID=A0A162UPL0_9CLOT|nr:flagellar biosynthetic protein FliO [Clostridium magnum]KZL94147.1 flagellar protein FliO/FliZ [Clostridium magnum DSM 2767]SHH94192.1 flagellar protein FliO/FliZ [Clostridium magnum DSM 2767]
MDLQFLWMLFKIIIFLPFILLLIYISIKYGGNKLQDIQNGRYIKILERAAISKENALLVVKIGEKGYVMSSVTGKLEIVSELEKEEISKIESARVIPQYESLKDFYEKSGFKNFCDKTNLTTVYEKLKIKKGR